MVNLEGKVALVTGASGGIGAATALRLHAQGAKLVLSDLDPGPLGELAAQLGDDTIACPGNVTSPEANAAMVDAALDRFGKLDIAVLNAGIECKFGLISEGDIDDFNRVMAVNVAGVYLGLSKAMPAMSAGQGGSIVILSSTAGRRGSAGLASYVTSKHAVVGLMKTAALEGAEHGIRVNTVNPGPIGTRMMKSLEKEISPDQPGRAQAFLEQKIPMGRYGTADEVARFIAFLASDDASYCTGNVYGVDGGLTTV